MQLHNIRLAMPVKMQMINFRKILLCFEKTLSAKKKKNWGKLAFARFLN
jgi:hypothetical protein